jgi:hypothetical protein
LTIISPFSHFPSSGKSAFNYASGSLTFLDSTNSSFCIWDFFHLAKCLSGMYAFSCLVIYQDMFFHSLAMENNATTNVGFQIVISFPLNIHPEWDCIVLIFLIFLGTSLLFYILFFHKFLQTV